MRKFEFDVRTLDRFDKNSDLVVAHNPMAVCGTRHREAK